MSHTIADEFDQGRVTPNHKFWTHVQRLEMTIMNTSTTELTDLDLEETSDVDETEERVSDLELLDFNRHTASALGVKIHELEKTGRGHMAEVYAEVHSWLNDKLVPYPALGDLKEVTVVECITARFCGFAGCSHTRYVYLNENVSSVSKTASEHGYPREYMRGAEEVFKQIRAFPELFEAYPTWEEFSAAKKLEKKDPNSPKAKNKLAITILALLGARVGEFDGDDEVSRLANVLVRDIRKACTA